MPAVGGGSLGRGGGRKLGARPGTVTLPGGLHQTVNVRGAASSIATQPIDTTSAVHGGAVTAQDLETIPLAHRSFANIAYLVPGTEPVEPSDPTKARITAVSFGGSSGLNDALGGRRRQLGRLHRRLPAEFLARRHPGIRGADLAGGRGHRPHHRRLGRDHHQARHRSWHGDAAFYERAAALNARFPIENPPPNPKQPFSRQNYIGTLGGPIVKDKLWFFSSIEAVHEDASIAYSPASLTQFNALASLAAQGLIPGVSSIPVPAQVPVPFRDYLGIDALRLVAIGAFAVVPARVQ